MYQSGVSLILNYKFLTKTGYKVLKINEIIEKIKATTRGNNITIFMYMYVYYLGLVIFSFNLYVFFCYFRDHRFSHHLKNNNNNIDNNNNNNNNKNLLLIPDLKVYLRALSVQGNTFIKDFSRLNTTAHLNTSIM
jgi:hypothetical protein